MFYAVFAFEKKEVGQSMFTCTAWLCDSLCVQQENWRTGQLELTLAGDNMVVLEEDTLQDSCSDYNSNKMCAFSFWAFGKGV